MWAAFFCPVRMYTRRGFCASCAACTRPGTSHAARRICARMCQSLREPLKRSQSVFYARGYKYLSRATKTSQRPRTRPTAALQWLTAQRPRHNPPDRSGSDTAASAAAATRRTARPAARRAPDRCPRILRCAVEALRRPRRARTAASTRRRPHDHRRRQIAPARGGCLPSPSLPSRPRRDRAPSIAPHPPRRKTARFFERF